MAGRSDVGRLMSMQSSPGPACGTRRAGGFFLWIPTTGSRCCIAGYIPSTAYFSRSWCACGPSWWWWRGGEDGGEQRHQGHQGQRGTGLGAPCFSPPVPPKVISEALFQNWLGAHDGVDGLALREQGSSTSSRESDVFSYRFAKAGTYRAVPPLPAGSGDAVGTNDSEGTSHPSTPSKPHLISLALWPAGDGGTLGPAWTATAQARWAWK